MDTLLKVLPKEDEALRYMLIHAEYDICFAGMWRCCEMTWEY